MKALREFPLLLVVTAFATAGAKPQEPPPKEEQIISELKDIPNFLWGRATAIYQEEGAWGKHRQAQWQAATAGDGETNVFSAESEGSNHPDEYGFNSFRMSISWPRVFPRGEDGVHRPNQEAVQFYKEIVNQQLELGVKPSVSMYHWDLPDEYDWLNETVVDAFVDYSDFLFRTFPEVNHWVTFNEPLTFCVQGYGDAAANRSNDAFAQYVCGHNVLKAHALAARNFHQNYQRASGRDAAIGITLNYEWAHPWNASDVDDQDAAQLHRDFELGWWADPVFLTGDYPPSMRSRLGDNLPQFTAEEKASLRSSADFFGVNAYGAQYAKAAEGLYPYFTTYQGPDTVMTLDGTTPASEMPWLYRVPNALRKLLMYINQRYRLTAIYVTETGCDEPSEADPGLEVALSDAVRVDYYRDYLEEAALAVTEDNVPLRGYYAWSPTSFGTQGREIIGFLETSSRHHRCLWSEGE